MDLLHIVTQMLMIFGIVLVGLFAAKRDLWSGDLDRKLSVFIMNISMPALILASVMGKDLAFENSELVGNKKIALFCKRTKVYLRSLYHLLHCTGIFADT